MHQRLKPLQDQIIPNSWFRLCISTIPSEGVPSYKQDRQCSMPEDNFELLVEEALWKFTKYGVAYGNAKLDNLS